MKIENLSEKVFEFECEVSREEFALEVKKDIDKLNKEIKDYDIIITNNETNIKDDNADSSMLNWLFK